MQLCSEIFLNHRKSGVFIVRMMVVKIGNVFCLPMPMPVLLTCAWIQIIREYFMHRPGAFTEHRTVWKVAEMGLVLGKVPMVATLGETILPTKQFSNGLG